MKISIFGSWRDKYLSKWPLLNRDKFGEACFQIGQAVAKRGHIITIVSDDPDTVDYHVFQGAINSIKEYSISKPIIEVFPQSDGNYPFANIIKEYSQNFLFREAVSPKRIRSMFSIREADAVLTIGGGDGTYEAGITAIVANKRLVTIGSFGGASLQLIELLDSHSIKSTALPSKSNLSILRGLWTSATLDAAICSLGLCDYPRIMLIHGRNQDWRKLRTYLQDELKLFQPIVMGQEFGDGRTLPKKFEELALRIDGAIAIATPDDWATTVLTGDGMSITEEQKVYYARARQNVWMEVGWIWGSLGLRKIMILTKGEIEIPSDLYGIELYTYNHNPSEAGEHIQAFIASLQHQG